MRPTFPRVKPLIRLLRRIGDSVLPVAPAGSRSPPQVCELS